MTLPFFGDDPIVGDDPLPQNTGSDVLASEIGQQLDNFSRRLAAFFVILANLVTSLGGILRSIWGFLKHIWENYIKAAIKWLAEHLKRLYDWLHREAKAILKWAQKVKKWYDTHILPWQLKQLALIQHIRQVLGILKAFHVKWAQTLDNKLADIQSHIVDVIDLVRGTLNTIINTLAIAFDPTMILTPGVLGASILKYLGPVKRWLAYGQGRALTSAELAIQKNNVGRYQTSTSRSHISALAASGLTSYDQSELAAFRKELPNVTGTGNVL
jgi:hypothetical protein